jgi:hypothetical protein
MEPDVREIIFRTGTPTIGERDILVTDIVRGLVGSEIFSGL